MKLLFTHEMHSVKCDGHFYNPKGMIGYDNLLNYLHSIPTGILISRCVGNEIMGNESWLPIDGDKVKVVPIPDIRSFFSLIVNFLRVHKTVAEAIKVTDRYIVRLPGVCGMAVALSLILHGKKYAVEFVGHPTETIEKTLRDSGKRRPIMLWLLRNIHAFLLKRAVAVAYRSEYLKREFPSLLAEHEVVFSGAQLKGEFITSPKPLTHFSNSPFQIVSIGRLMPEKGYHTLIEAFACAQDLADSPMRLRIVGDGELLPDLKKRAEELGVEDLVDFPGRVKWGNDLFMLMDDAHLFVLPSLTEGMPRSLIEAMARGMPAIGSSCGGIPELLDKDCLVEPGKVKPLAEKIVALSECPYSLEAMSQKNFEASKLHWPDNLRKSKDLFWSYVVDFAK